MRKLLYPVALFAIALTASAGSLLYSIGPTEYGQPARVVSIDPATGAATPLFDLNSGAAGFSGLTYNPASGLFYAVMDDPGYPSQLVSFSASGAGAFSPLMSLDTGSINPLDFNGGLVRNPNDGDFYSIANSSAGESFLYRIDVAGGTLKLLTERLPPSFNGGLTMNGDGTLDAFLNDSQANSSVYRFTFAQSGDYAMATEVWEGVGTAFYGGLVWDGGTLYALNSDSTGASFLNSMDGAGNVTNLFDAGSGLYNAGLTLGPGVETPEPATWGLLAAGLGLLGAARRRRPKTN